MRVMAAVLQPGRDNLELHEVGGGERLCGEPEGDTVKEARQERWGEARSLVTSLALLDQASPDVSATSRLENCITQ